MVGIGQFGSAMRGYRNLLVFLFFLLYSLRFFGKLLKVR